MAAASAPPKSRTQQPRCANTNDSQRCNHPLSFHSDRGKCKALGCWCTSWVEPPEEEHLPPEQRQPSE